MANSHVSYLQTLAKEEAIAFVDSLQKVKEHLSHELQWMNGQVQQKTIQLQGIDHLLAEAVGLGLLAPPTVSTTSTEIEQTSGQIAPSLSAALVETNGSSLAESVLAASTAPPKRGKQPANKTSPSKRSAKPPTARKTSASKTATKVTATKTTTPKTNKPERPAQSASAPSKGAESGFQQFLQPSFQDKSMTDAVGEILAAAKEPMNTDAIMAQLYTGLSGDPYQRAKSSLSNILSVGKTKGKWKSPGRGMYIGS